MINIFSIVILAAFTYFIVFDLKWCGCGFFIDGSCIHMVGCITEALKLNV
jgi:hypothetical protein